MNNTENTPNAEPLCDRHDRQTKVTDPFTGRSVWVCDCGALCGEA